MKETKRANIYFIIIMLLEVFAPFIITPIYKILGIKNLGLVLVLNHAIIFLIPAAIYLIITKSNIKQTLRLNAIQLKDALIMILIGILSYPVSIFFSLITSLLFPNNVATVIGNLMSMPFIIVILIVAVTPAITEEVTVRGIILNGYQSCSRYKSSIITGVIFGMLHLDGQQFLYATVLGFVLAMVVNVTNSILAGCITHFTMNGISLTIQMLISNFLDMSSLSSSQETSLLDLGVIPLVFAFVFYGSIAIASGAAIWALIRYVEKKNIKKGIIQQEDRKGWFKKGEKTFDMSTISMILVYIIIMIINYNI